MTVDFRCENCGKLLSIDDQPGNMVRCPHCHKKVSVPEGLAALPRPHVPPNARPAAAAASGSQGQGRADGQPDEGEEGQEEEVEGGAVIGAMATIMPWVISAFLHLGVFMVMLFFVMVVVNTKIPPEIIIPDAALNLDNPGGVMNPKTETVSKSANERRTVVKRYTKREEQVDKGKTEKTVELLAASADGARGGAAELGLTNSDAAGGPKSRFFGSGGNAYHIAYVVDRSGSMAPTFQQVQLEMLKSISKLQAAQDFTIILFSENQFIEGPQKRMVSAELDNKVAANNFLKDITASGETTVLPALKRAFDVLKYADARKPGRLIYLLSDGDFAGMSGGSTHTGADGKVLTGNEAVIQWLRENNPKDEKKGLVHVNTFLYLSKDDEAKKVMDTIATENGGRFKLISADE